jgi:hypothetical protein
MNQQFRGFLFGHVLKKQDADSYLSDEDEGGNNPDDEDDK